MDRLGCCSISQSSISATALRDSISICSSRVRLLPDPATKVSAVVVSKMVKVSGSWGFLAAASSQTVRRTISADFGL